MVSISNDGLVVRTPACSSKIQHRQRFLGEEKAACWIASAILDREQNYATRMHADEQVVPCEE